MEIPALQVQDVEKRFARVTAVDGLTFDVRRGEIFALLGPNGAGKSTLVRMLMGILKPDGGVIEFGLGNRVGVRPLSAQLGYLPEDRGLYKDQPIQRILTYFGTLRGMDSRDANRAAGEWLERIGLAERAKDKLDTLSKGNQQKVQFASAVLHRPDFAVLDEPFSGLDPLNQEMFLDLIRDLREQGMTILLSAHQMDLVERLVDRMLLMNRGHEVLSGTMGEIRQRAQVGSRIRLRVRGQVEIGVLERHPSVSEATLDNDNEISILLRPGVGLSDLLVTAGNHFDIQEVLTEQVTLHEIYVRAVGADAVATDGIRSVALLNGATAPVEVVA